MPRYTIEIGIEGIDELSPVLGQVEQRLKDVGDTGERELGRVNDSMASLGMTMQNTASQLRPVGFALAGIGAAITGVIGAGVMKFAPFEQAMANVRAVSGATDEEFKAMEAEARRLGEEMGKFTAEEAAEGLNYLAMAGLSAKESVAALQPTLQLAQAAQVDMGEAADILTNIMTGMGIETKDLTRVNDVLIKGFTSSNTNLQRLGEAFSYAAGAARSAGLTVEETTAVLGEFANAGMRGTRGGTALEAMLRMMARVTPQAQRELNKLNVSLTDARGNFLPLPDIVQQFETALADVPGEAERLRILNVIFGQAGARGINALIAQGSDKLREFIDELNNAGGTAEQVAAIQTATLQEAFGEMTSAITGAAMTIGEIFAPAVEKTADAIKWLVGLFNRMPKPLQALISVGMGVVGVLTLMAGTAILLLGPFGSLLTGTSRLLQILPMVVPWVTATARAFWAWAASVRGVQAALVGTGIGALIVGGGFLLEQFLKPKQPAIQLPPMRSLGGVPSTVNVNINNANLPDREAVRRFGEYVGDAAGRAAMGAR